MSSPRSKPYDIGRARRVGLGAAPWALLVPLTMLACGGDDSTSPTHPDPVLLTMDNARSITSALWLGHAATSADDIVSAQLRDVLYEYLPLLAYRPNELEMEIGCGESGTVTLTGDVVDRDKPGESRGDHATAVFTECTEHDSSLIPEIARGTLSVEVSDSSATQRVVLAAFEDLAIEIASSGPINQNGEITFTLSADSSTTTMETESFTVSGLGLTRLLTDYLLRLRVPSDGEYLLEFGGTQSGVEIAGAVTFETTVPFHGRSQGYPDAGRLELIGAEDSTVVLEALPDGESVVLTVNDTNTIETTWFDLEE